MNNVLLITDIFPPDIGGPATFIDRLAQALTQAGRRVTVICGSDDRCVATDSTREFRVVRIVRGNRLAYYAKLYAALAYHLRMNKVVLINGLESMSCRVARVLGRRYTLKIVGDTVWETARNSGLTSLGIDEFQKNAPSSPLLKTIASRRQRFLSGAQRIIVPSEYLRDLVQGWGVEASRIRVIYNGIPLDDYAAYKSLQRDVLSEPLEVAFCGRLTNWKGVETLLLAMAQTDASMRLTVMGDGPEMPMLEGLARQLKVSDRVEFTGRLEVDALRTQLNKAHVLALASGYEGLSHTLLEAAAMGLALVASDCTGNREIVKHQVNGLLAPYGIAQAWADALRRLAEDETLRLRLAREARETSMNFSFQETVRKTIDLISE